MTQASVTLFDVALMAATVAALGAVMFALLRRPGQGHQRELSGLVSGTGRGATSESTA